MKNRPHGWLALAVALGLLAGNVAPLSADLTPTLRRVNAPYFPGGVQFSQSAIFWFGQVNPNTSYTDVRIGYDNNEVLVHVAMFDRLLWYNPNPTTDALTNWDSVSLYFNKTGPTGTTPGQNQSYRFDGQLNWWEPRAPWQAEYNWNGSKWITATATFTTVTSFAYETSTVGGFNNDLNNRGWNITFHIPFRDLGVTGHPDPGSLWGLAVAVHDRDAALGVANSMEPDEFWPETANPASPASWGQLYFGTPDYTPPPASPGGTVTIRNGLNGTVTEAAVGGANLCGWPRDNYWNVWGNRIFSYSNDYTYTFNIQNQYLIADWPCFAKYYTTFPLDAVPSNKVVISATLTLNQSGNSGSSPGNAYIQVLTVGEAWNPDQLKWTWNGLPMARENVAILPVPALNGAPAVFRTWDVSRAVAEAYGAGQPLRLAMYSADGDDSGQYGQTGRYFSPSNYPDGYLPDALYRPTLRVLWGDASASATLHKTVTPLYPVSGQPLNYTLSFLGSGSALTVTDSLPPEVGNPGTIVVNDGGAGGGASYNSAAHRISWTGTPAQGQAVTLVFPVTPLTPGTMMIRNTAVLTDSLGRTSIDVATAIVDPIQVWLSLMRR